MNSLRIVVLMAFISLPLAGCVDDASSDSENRQNGGYPGQVIADYTIANEATLRAIPVQFINTARTTLHVAYQHTSHGTHVSYGVSGLPGYKTGDAALFGVFFENQTPDPNKLDFRDYYVNEGAGSLGNGVIDLSNGVDGSGTPAFVTSTRAYLDNPASSSINVVMWSWCSIRGHNVANYLAGMQTLINEYGPGGSRIGAGPGATRTTPVTFVFMTGHAEGSSNIGPGLPKNQADLIVDYCMNNGYFCLDYYSIDTHDMQGAYYSDADDNGYSPSLNLNYYENWQSTHTLGVDWFQNRVYPGGGADHGIHTSQHITSNRKAFAFWWILARISGWSG